MGCDIEPVLPQGPVYRVARAPDPWAHVDWAYAGPDGTFGGRYDDPHGEYRVTYASATRVGALMETLAGFRTPPAVRAGIAEPDGGDAPEPDTVPAEFLAGRRIGEALLPELHFAEVGHSRSLAFLRVELADVLAAYGLDDLDAAAVRLTVPRRFTQLVGRLVFDCVTDDGGPQFAGVRYGSRLGDELHNWALFERPGAGLTHTADQPLEADDPDVAAALDRLGLRLV
jgi:hypothetical protein